jgi:hypothetical protein
MVVGLGILYLALAMPFVWLATLARLSWTRSVVIGAAILMLGQTWWDTRRDLQSGNPLSTEHLIGVWAVIPATMIAVAAIMIWRTRRNAH